jgi:hypothetical protein
MISVTVTMLTLSYTFVSVTVVVYPCVIVVMAVSVTVLGSILGLLLAYTVDTEESAVKGVGMEDSVTVTTGRDTVWINVTVPHPGAYVGGHSHKFGLKWGRRKFRLALATVKSCTMAMA